MRYISYFSIFFIETIVYILINWFYYCNRSIKEKRLSTYSQQSCPQDAIRNGSGSNLDINNTEGILSL
jgi:hypothetical protein